MKILSVLMILVALTGCGSNKGSGSNGITTLIGYGDSITYGAYNNHISFIDLISHALNYHPVNKAISGTSMFSANQYDLLMSDSFNSTDIIFFTPGINDAGYYGNDPAYVAQYQSALEDILNRIHSLGIKAYIGTPIQVLQEVGPMTNANIALYAEINRKVVQNQNDPNIVLVDFNTGYSPVGGNDWSDGIHPVSQGYQAMTQFFLMNYR